MTEIRAFLFDFDGLLADTEPVHFAGFRDTVAGHGITLDEANYFESFVGYDDRDGFREIFRQHGLDAPGDQLMDDLIRDKAERVQKLMARDLSIKPGAVDFLGAAADRYLVGVCSGALRPEVDLGLRAMGVADRIVRIVTAEDVLNSKPDPEGYVQLMRLLNKDAVSDGQPELRPDQCVVLEDTIYGLRSGRGAGCWTVGVHGTETPERLEEQADLVLESLQRTTPARVIEQLAK